MQDTILLYLQLEADFVSFLEGDVKVAGIENLAQFGMDGALHFILVKPRADRLADFGEQFGFLGTAMGIERYHIVFQRQAQLQRESYHQPRTPTSEHLPLHMRKQNHSKVVLPCLQADRREVADFRFRHYALEIGEPSGGSHGRRLGHLGHVMHGEDSTLPVG